MNLNGIYPASVTPFNGDGSIHFNAFHSHLERLIAAGNHGLVINAVTGEGPSLTPDERAACVKEAVACAAGRVPVIATVGSVAIAETISDAMRAEQAGASAIMIIAPYFYRLSSEEKVGFFLRIGEKVRLPFLIYNTTYATGQLSVDELVRISEATTRFIGVKEGGQMQASEDVRRLSPKVTILASRDTFIHELGAAGGKGAVTYSSNVVPELPVALWKAHQAGDRPLALALQQALNPIALNLVVKSFPNGVKAGMNALGWQAGPLRLPLIDLDAKEQQVVLDLVRAANERLATLSRG